MSSIQPTMLTEEKAREWWRYFCRWPGFGQLWSSEGWATRQLLPYARQLTDSLQPPLETKGEQTAFLIPVHDLQWCILAADFGSSRITNGAVWACMSGFNLLDFSLPEVYPFPYRSLRPPQREGDRITLRSTNYDIPLALWFRVPRPDESTRSIGFVFDVLRAVSARDSADREANYERTEREAEAYHDAVDRADRFVEAFFTFFSQVAGSSVENLKS